VQRVLNHFGGLLSFIVIVSSLHGAPYTIRGRRATGRSADCQNSRDHASAVDRIAVIRFAQATRQPPDEGNNAFVQSRSEMA
jgi:hypothetical protein